MKSKVDRSVLEALPAELREQVEQSWTSRDGRPNNRHSTGSEPSGPLPQPPSPLSRPTSPPRPPPASGTTLYPPHVGTIVLQIPNQPDSPGIVLELPNISQVRVQQPEFDCHGYIQSFIVWHKKHIKSICFVIITGCILYFIFHYISFSRRVELCICKQCFAQQNKVDKIDMLLIWPPLTQSRRHIAAMWDSMNKE